MVNPVYSLGFCGLLVCLRICGFLVGCGVLISAVLFGFGDLVVACFPLVWRLLVLFAVLRLSG